MLIPYILAPNLITNPWSHLANSLGLPFRSLFRILGQIRERIQRIMVHVFLHAGCVVLTAYTE